LHKCSILRATRAHLLASVEGMPELSRTQVAVYGAIAIALLFIGARAVRGESGGESDSAYTTSYGDYSSEDDSGSESESEVGFSVEEGGTDVVVDVTGAVRKPGVYRMPAGSRVNDAVKRAGGATGKASLDSINLAARLADGQQVVVPEAAPAAAVGGAAAGATAAEAAGEEDAPISLSTATATELDTIDGIGPVTAEDIIGFREEHGGLSSVDQLDQISGIGPATMEALRERLQP
jgi:competence protein ComEA